MSVSPLQNFSKPPPVPETPTVTRTSGATERNSSATASVTGKTVLEPSIATLPDSFSPPAAVVVGPSSSPQATISIVAARASMTSGSRLLHRIAITRCYLLCMSLFPARSTAPRPGPVSATGIDARRAGLTVD